jgi:hypothetical protein
MNWKLIAKNWKTSISGAILWLLSIAPLVEAVQDWSRGKRVDWRMVFITAVLWAGGHGLLQAKDSTTHSTAEEVHAATYDETKKPAS